MKTYEEFAIEWEEAFNRAGREVSMIDPDDFENEDGFCGCENCWTRCVGERVWPVVDAYVRDLLDLLEATS